MQPVVWSTNHSLGAILVNCHFQTHTVQYIFPSDYFSMFHNDTVGWKLSNCAKMEMRFVAKQTLARVFAKHVKYCVLNFTQIHRSLCVHSVLRHLHSHCIGWCVTSKKAIRRRQSCPVSLGGCKAQHMLEEDPFDRRAATTFIHHAMPSHTATSDFKPSHPPLHPPNPCFPQP